MKKILLSFLSFVFILTANAQIKPDSAILQINNIKAAVNASGDLFRDLNTKKSSFESPKGSGKHTVYAGGIWIGGKDPGGVLHVAAQTYRQSNKYDFNTGALDTTNASIDTNVINQYNRVWVVSKQEIDSFKAGKPASIDISAWPAHGDASKKQAKYLAPFVDKNSDGIYDTNDGDYPCVKGDRSAYFIYNDAYTHSKIGSPALGVEVHAMVYAFNNGIEAIDNTVFVDYKIINRSNVTYSNTHIGVWTDTEIGLYSDDYIGCDVGRDAFYGYNADSIDGDGNGGTYGTTPPAQATIILRGPIADGTDGKDNNHNGVTDELYETIGMSSFIYMANNAGPNGDPVTGNDFYNYTTGHWKDGTPIMYGYSGGGFSGDSCRYMFPDNSDPNGYGTYGIIQPAWSEISAQTFVSDRRGVAGIGSFTLLPNQVKYINVAHLYSRASNGNHLSSVSKLKGDIDIVRSFFHANASNAFACDNHPVGIEKITNKNSDQYVVYPNPSNGKFVIKTFSQLVNIPYEIFDYTGRIVASGQFNATETSFDISELGQGLYLLKISDIESKVISVVK